MKISELIRSLNEHLPHTGDVDVLILVKANDKTSNYRVALHVDNVHHQKLKSPDGSVMKICQLSSSWPMRVTEDFGDYSE